MPAGGRMLRAIAVLLALGASPALALSCMPYAPVDGFRDAQASATRYTVVHGVLTFDTRKLPEHYDENARDVTIDARVRGQALSPSGFDAPFNQNVSLAVQCAGPWCPSVRSGVQYLLFIEKQGSGYRLVADACPTTLFPSPSRADLQDMVRCLSGACP